MRIITRLLFIILVSGQLLVNGQSTKINWMADGLSYTKLKDGNIIKIDPKKDVETIIVKKEQLIPEGESSALVPQSYSFSNDNLKILLFTNTAKVWRYKTRGDYWIFNAATGKLSKLGKGRPSQSLMFAKFSPDSRQVAYVSEHNIFSEDISTGLSRKLTSDGSRKLINGTFDWVYEEEFFCRDGFRWSPDSRQIAFWQVDATKIRDYFMLNTTDSVYSKVIPVEYPKVGESPSPTRIGTVSVSNGLVRWMKIEGDPRQHYITRMEWSAANELVVQRLDRKQQESRLIYCNASDGNSRTFWAENDNAWVDLNSDDPTGWNWINKGQDFLWVSEKDGWRHIYKISRDGKSTTLLTNGNYDIGEIKGIDESNNYVYFTASPSNATQLYLYRARLNNSKDADLVSDAALKGTHKYSISPKGKLALHTFSNHKTPAVKEWISLPDGKPLDKSKSILATMKTDPDVDVEYFQIVTDDNILLDAWMNKPKNFDSTKKYPVVLYVYGEPATSTVSDEYGLHNNFLYGGDMRGDGYIQVSIDNRGTPSLKGAGWRKSVYRKLGTMNIQDLVSGTRKFLERSYVDKERVAVWGWSGGGASTLHLMFRYPEIFQTGIAVSAITNLLFYDNVYLERYMGLPQENKQDYIDGSALTYAKGLKGNLLYIHGTGDDNVHYSNAEALVNELIKNNKQFQIMPYPNRTHNINEGEGTVVHLISLYTNYLKKNCPPGGR